MFRTRTFQLNAAIVFIIDRFLIKKESRSNKGVAFF